MADNITLNSGTGGAVVATDDDGTAHHQYVKLEFGADNTQTKVTTSVGLPTDPLDRAARDCGKIDIAMGQGAHDAAGAAIDPVAIGGYASAAAPTDVTADGDLCRIWTTLKGAVNIADAGGTISIDDGAGNISIDDGGNSITVDNTTLSVTGGGVEASALRVTIASDSTGVVSVDDNGGSLTVDGTVAISGTVTVDSELPAAAALGDAVANPTAPAVGAFLMGFDAGSSNWERLTTDTNGALVTSSAITGAALTALQKIDDPVLVDDAAFTPATSSVMMSGFEADETGTDSVDEGDAGAARMTLDRKQIVTPQPHSAGGLSIFRSIDLDETEEDVKTSAGCMYGLWVTNTATSTRFVKFYNATAANTTVGTTTPVITIGIPGNSSDDITGFFSSTHGIMFDTAICAAATTGVADNDTGAPGANEVIVNVFYK